MYYRHIGYSQLPPNGHPSIAATSPLRPFLGSPNRFSLYFNVKNSPYCGHPSNTATPPCGHPFCSTKVPKSLSNAATLSAFEIIFDIFRYSILTQVNSHRSLHPMGYHTSQGIKPRNLACSRFGCGFFRGETPRVIWGGGYNILFLYTSPLSIWHRYT